MVTMMHAALPVITYVLVGLVTGRFYFRRVMRRVTPGSGNFAKKRKETEAHALLTATVWPVFLVFCLAWATYRGTMWIITCDTPAWWRRERGDTGSVDLATIDAGVSDARDATRTERTP